MPSSPLSTTTAGIHHDIRIAAAAMVVLLLLGLVQGHGLGSRQEGGCQRRLPIRRNDAVVVVVVIGRIDGRKGGKEPQCRW